MKQAAQSSNGPLLSVLPWARTTQQHEKQLWSCYGVSASILKCVGCFGLSSDTTIQIAVTQSASPGHLQHEASNLQERDGEKPREG